MSGGFVVWLGFFSLHKVPTLFASFTVYTIHLLYYLFHVLLVVGLQLLVHLFLLTEDKVTKVTVTSMLDLFEQLKLI